MISVIIPTYKNKLMFLKNLHNNLKFLDDTQIIIVNDDPEQSLRDDLKKIKNITLIENKKNLGFGQSINTAVSQAKYSYIMLLNNDVLLINKNYQTALYHFQKNKNLFAVSFAQEERDGSVIGKNIIYWKSGLIYHKKAEDLNSGYTAWAEGGASIINKEKFINLGGFDPIYTPFYWEDIDLSYRAWRAGYQIFFDSKIMVKHHHQSTIVKYFPKKTIETVAYRNQLIFVWKNISDIKMLANHFLLFPYNLFYYSLLKREFNFLQGFIEALKYIKIIIKQRRLSKVKNKLSKKQIIELFSI